MRNIKNPTDNTGYMPLKRHIALTVIANGEKEYRMYRKLKNINRPNILCKENRFLFTE
jgi:hypothetical protein